MTGTNAIYTDKTTFFHTATFVGSVERELWTKNATAQSIQIDSELGKNKITARAGRQRVLSYSDLPSPAEEELYDESFWVRQLERLKEKNKFVRLDDI
jgi:hypothetical protein